MNNKYIKPMAIGDNMLYIGALLIVVVLIFYYLSRIRDIDTVNVIQDTSTKQISTIPVQTTNPVSIEAPVPIKEQVIPVKYPKIRSFLDSLQDCKWCIACGSYARYTRLAGESKGIPIKEFRINAKVDNNMIAGHQMNYTIVKNHLIYIDNTGNSKDIIEPEDLHSYILKRYGETF